MKNAIVILSDPQPATPESTARVMNALGFADECRRHGDDLAIVFAGTGTRWPAELSKPTHPGHTRYNGVREFVRGASRACAVRNDAVAGLEQCTVPLLSENQIPGTPGAASFRQLYAEGWQVTVF